MQISKLFFLTVAMTLAGCCASKEGAYLEERSKQYRDYREAKNKQEDDVYICAIGVARGCESKCHFQDPNRPDCVNSYYYDNLNSNDKHEKIICGQNQPDTKNQCCSLAKSVCEELHPAPKKGWAIENER